ncbi:L-histidine N(alpha)-methyltransferase [Marinicaulis aureus]|uniref:Probable nicotinate-nucleotide adenylyltransferase n=1 Tax=Hyphococcus aureus TaxID=2666033 RepID=A0ABW1KWG0_9PROT
MPSSQKTERRRIGLLGGSFNPPHQGHREISLAALERMGLDAVWWLVTPGNPLKDPKIYAAYEDRLRLARVVANHPDIVVSDFERRRGLQYTAETLDALQAINPNAAFVWLMGADGLANFHRWKDWRHIAETVPIAVFNRPGHSNDALVSEAAKELGVFRIDPEDAMSLSETDPPVWVFFADTENPLSSTAIRSRKISHSLTIDRPDDLIAPCGALAFFLDLHPDLGDFRADVIEGLSLPQKTISPKYFYDDAGSKLFDQITGLDEYYPTRTEKKVFLENAAEITAAIGPRAAIFEYGSGSSEKIEWLVNGLKEPAAYVAMDISRDHLLENASAIAEVLPIPVAAICADFHSPIELPKSVLPPADHWLGYFPGSTLGNMTLSAAKSFLERASATLGPGAQFLIGVDLVKDKAVLEAAYNDARGVTAAFNMNLLARMKSELGAKLNIDDFEHYAFYNDIEDRIEMHLRAKRATVIEVDGEPYGFVPGETLHTENSHKFTLEKLKALVNQTPWRLEKSWTDEKAWFGACLLSNS